jgi:hypothetical protein
LYEALGETGNPEFTTVMRIVRALGLTLSARPRRRWRVHKRPLQPPFTSTVHFGIRRTHSGQHAPVTKPLIKVSIRRLGRPIDTPDASHAVLLGISLFLFKRASTVAAAGRTVASACEGSLVALERELAGIVRTSAVRQSPRKVATRTTFPNANDIDPVDL